MSCMNDQEASGYAGFICNAYGFPMRLTIMSTKWTCPNCDVTIKPHEEHGEKECAFSDKPPKFWWNAMFDET